MDWNGECFFFVGCLFLYFVLFCFLLLLLFDFVIFFFALSLSFLRLDFLGHNITYVGIDDPVHELEANEADGKHHTTIFVNV